MALLRLNKAVWQQRRSRNDLQVLVNALIVTNSRIVGQPEVIQAVSNRLNWRKIAITLIDPGAGVLSVIALITSVEALQCLTWNEHGLEALYSL
jgi:hypothetical protein